MRHLGARFGAPHPATSTPARRP